MTLVDSRGRLFGRLNVVDALLLLFLVALVPLAYGAYALFRSPPPALSAIEPATLTHAATMRITVRGRDLRPYMRVVVGEQQARNFLFHSATTAEVDLPTLKPGVYDVALYDYAQERARLVGALTITPPPLPSSQLDVVGVFRALPADAVKTLTVGMKVGDAGTITQLAAPVPSVVRALAGDMFVEVPVDAVDLPAVVRLGCELQGAAGRVQCLSGGVALMAEAYLTFETPAGSRSFQIDQVRAPLPLTNISVRVQLRGDPQALALVRTGDADVGLNRNPLAAGASVLNPGANSGNTREVTLRVPAQPGATGWRYAGFDVRAGASFRLLTRTYDLSGVVLQVTPEQPPTEGESPQ